jgi:hypothetical protein
MIRRSLLGLFLGLAPVVSGCASERADTPAARESEQNAGGPITLENWRNHPDIMAALKLVSDVEIAIYDGKLQTSLKEKLCTGSGEESRQKWTDASGKIRKLVLTAGSDDSFGTMTVWYDEAGEPRHLHNEFNTVHGTGRIDQLYFDPRGHLLWDVIRERAPGEEGTETPYGDWRRPRPVEEDEFDTFAVDDHNVLDDPPVAFDAEPRCN